jgi:NADP-dependent 3-hydroxy acid dehydrogenase YdfG
MPFAYKRVLLVGATAGIGAAMAERLIAEGAKVVVVGRRQDRLDAFVQKHGNQRAGSIKFDISDTNNVGTLVDTVTSTYPDLDCVFLNAGVQSNINLGDPEHVDLAAFHQEIKINFTSFVDLTIKILPFLKGRNIDTSLIL